MRTKWYFSALIIVFTVLGICQQKNTVPNQEILVEFVNDEVTPEDILNTIATVKKTLHIVGIDNIKVEEQNNGTLKITYYSNVNVAIIKKILSKGGDSELEHIAYSEKGNSEIPSSENLNNYNLDVYEIQKSSGTGLDFDGKYVFEIKYEYDRFSNPNVYVPFGVIDTSAKDKVVKVAYRIRRNIAIAIDNTSHNIPEVRAGPAFIGV